MDLTAGIYHKHPSLSRKGLVMSLVEGDLKSDDCFEPSKEKAILVSDHILVRKLHASQCRSGVICSREPLCWSNSFRSFSQVIGESLASDSNRHGKKRSEV